MSRAGHPFVRGAGAALLSLVAGFALSGVVVGLLWLIGSVWGSLLVALGVSSGVPLLKVLLTGATVIVAVGGFLSWWAERNL